MGFDQTDDLMCPHCRAATCTMLWAGAPTRANPAMTRDIFVCPVCASVVPDEMSSELMESTSVETTYEGTEDRVIDYKNLKFPNQYVIDRVAGLPMPKGSERASVLDMGCGQGLVLRAFTKRGFRALGMDAMQAYVDMANDNGLEAHVGIFPHSVPAAIEDAKFSVISIFEAIYYLGCIDDVFSWTKEHLQPGGYLAVKSLNGMSPRLQGNNFFTRAGDIVTGVPQLHTLQFYAKRHGFRVVFCGKIPDDIFIDSLRIPLRRGKTFASRVINYLLPGRKADRVFLVAQTP